MTDRELRAYFGLTERALKRYRELKEFPQKDLIAGKTDMVAVGRFFDWVAGIAEQPPRPNSRYLPSSDRPKAGKAP